LHIVIATSEAVPFAKSGGLADVCGALPRELARLGHEVSLFVPAYRQVQHCGAQIEPLGVTVNVPVGTNMVTGQLARSCVPGGKVGVYLIRQDEYFDRNELYGAGGEDYTDNCARFVFFSRAVMEAIRLLELEVDVLHANDWQTGLIPAYLKIQYRNLPRYQRIASLFTIHNIAFQGSFWHWDMPLTGLDWKYFNWEQMEFHGRLNLLKTGIVFADSINTVSPRYAKEIQTSAFGCGLESVLQHRRDVLYGVLNGIDETDWNPANDPHIAARYGPETVWDGKPVCKAALQKELGLPQAPQVPLLAMIGRLTEQKGIDLIADCIGDWARTNDMQWVILGTGDPKYHRLFETLAQHHPEKIAVRLMFSNPLAHRIEAGADMFLMPSRFEPCGLNQLYSLKYGTVPIVHETGGLADTVTGYGRPARGPQPANGFSFQEYSAAALNETLQQAIGVYCEQPSSWRYLVDTGIRQDWSWANSAKEYERLYKGLLGR